MESSRGWFGVSLGFPGVPFFLVGLIGRTCEYFRLNPLLTGFEQAGQEFTVDGFGPAVAPGVLFLVGIFFTILSNTSIHIWYGIGVCFRPFRKGITRQRYPQWFTVVHGIVIFAIFVSSGYFQKGAS